MSLVTSFSPDAVLARRSGAERSVTLPSAGRAAFANMFDAIESSLEPLGISAYGISLTTLEEVFIRVTKDAERRRNHKNEENEEAPKLRFSLSDNDVANKPSEWAHFKTLTKTNVRQLIRSPSSLFCVVVIPTIFSIVSLLVYKSSGGVADIAVPSVMVSSQATYFEGDSFLYTSPAGSVGFPPCLGTDLDSFEVTRVSDGSLASYINHSSDSSFAGLAFDSLDCKHGYFEGHYDLYFNGSSPNAIAQMATILMATNKTQLSVSKK